MTNVVAISGFLTPFDYESVTVGVGSTTLTSTKYLVTGDNGRARLVMITVEGRVRFRFDGTAPTGTEGHILNDGDVMYLGSLTQMSQFKAIRHSGESVDAVLKVTYLR
jgi:hypothetical protein